MSKRYRSIQFKFYATEEEAKLIEKNIKKSGMSKGTYLRNVAINATINVKDIKNAKAILVAMSKIGTNINQLVRYTHQIRGATNENIQELIEWVEKLWQLLRLKL